MAKIVITEKQAEMLQKLESSKVIKITVEQFKLIEAELKKDSLLGHPIAGDGSDYEAQSEKENEKTTKSFNEEAINENISISEFYQQVIDFIKHLYTDPSQDGLSTFWVKMGLTNGEVLTALTGTGLIMGTMVGGHMVYAMAKKGKPAEMIKKIAKVIYKLVKQKKAERVPIQYKGANQPKDPMDPRYSKMEEDNYPMGAQQHSDNPFYDKTNVTQGKQVSNKEFRCLWNDSEMAIVADSQNKKFIFSYHDKDKSEFRDYTEASYETEKDEDGYYAVYDDESWVLDTQVVEDYLNDNFKNMSIGKGLESYENGADLSLVDGELAQEIINLNKGDNIVAKLLTNSEPSNESLKSPVKPLKEGGIFRNFTDLSNQDFEVYKEAFKKLDSSNIVKRAKDGKFYVGFKGDVVIWKYIVADEKVYSDMDDSEFLKHAHPLNNPTDNVEETTTSGSSGAFVAPLGTPIKRKLATENEVPKITMFSDEEGVESKHMDEEEEEVYETTTTASSGQYVTPKMWAKNKENMRFGKKPMYPNGKIVKNKDLYSEIAKLTGKSEKDVQTIVERYLYNKTQRNE